MGTVKPSLYLVILIFLLLYIFPLGMRPFMLPDEPRYAEIPREMITSSDWIVPHFNGLRYFEKPVFGYWINAASMLLFGQNAFAARLPSALAVAVAAWMIILLFRKTGEAPWVGYFAAIVFLTSIEVFAVGVFNVLDSLLAMTLTLSMTAFFWAFSENRPWQKSGDYALFGLFCGLAFLTKGFLAFAVPVVAIVPFMIWERRLKELLTFPWIAIATATLVSLPWGLMIHFRESDFWHYFFWIEHIKRFSADTAQHAKPFWYYIPIVLLCILPWSFLLPAAVAGWKKNRTGGRLFRFAVCWFVFPFLFFSASKGKLVTYILPCMPPLALIIALSLQHFPYETRKPLLTIGTMILAGLVGALAFILLFSQLAGIPGLHAYNPTETWKWILAVIALCTWSFLLLFSNRLADFKKQLLLFAIAPLFFLCSIHFILPDLVKIRRAPGEFLLRCSDQIQQTDIIASDDVLAGSACWFFKRSDLYLLENAGEMTYGLEYAKDRLVDIVQFKSFVQKHHRTGGIVLVARSRKYRSWKKYLPAPLFIASSGQDGYTFARF